MHKWKINKKQINNAERLNRICTFCLNLWLKIILQNKRVPLSRKHWNLIIHPYSEPSQFIIPYWGYFSEVEIVVFSCVPDPKAKYYFNSTTAKLEREKSLLILNCDVVVAEKYNKTMILIQITIPHKTTFHEI